MLTGELKNKVDKIWEIFWMGVITNPLSVIEQFTYLLFIKDLDDKQTVQEKNEIILGVSKEKFFNENESQMRWKNFKQMGAEYMYDIVSRRFFRILKICMEIKILPFQNIWKMLFL